MEAKANRQVFPIFLTFLVTLLCFSLPASATEIGVFTGPGCAGVRAMPGFVNWFGAKPTRTIEMTDSRSWFYFSDNLNYRINCWKPTNLKVTFSIIMIPGDGSSTLAEGAKGAYDHYFFEAGQKLVAGGYGDAILRVGWEFNHHMMPWAAYKDPHNWVKMYRRVVQTLRSVTGAHFQFDWCSVPGNIAIPQDAIYPGDAYVDIISMDVYNQRWDVHAPNTPEAQWNALLTMPYGLTWLSDFARKHGKKVAIPEWATGTGMNGRARGDDAYFVRHMAKWIADNNVLYFDWWDYDRAGYDGTLETGKFPDTASAFKALFLPSIKRKGRNPAPAACDKAPGIFSRDMASRACPNQQNQATDRAPPPKWPVPHRD